MVLLNDCFALKCLILCKRREKHVIHCFGEKPDQPLKQTLSTTKFFIHELFLGFFSINKGEETMYYAILCLTAREYFFLLIVLVFF